MHKFLPVIAKGALRKKSIKNTYTQKFHHTDSDRPLSFRRSQWRNVHVSSDVCSDSSRCAVTALMLKEVVTNSIIIGRYSSLS